MCRDEGGTPIDRGEDGDEGGTPTDRGKDGIQGVRKEVSPCETVVHGRGPVPKSLLGTLIR